jgi:tripartite-type tricarboxylate transporter receptor subunit TctC
MSYGTSGIGSAVHLATEMFKQTAKIKMEHIPYKGGGPAVQDVLGGHVPAVTLGLSTVAPFIKAGKVRALFVLSAKRQSEFADVPTLQESGFPGLVADEWWGILAPAGTPKPIVDRLNAEITRIFTLPEVQERIGKLGIEFIGSTPAGLGEFIQSESVRWGKVLQTSGIKPE